MQLHPGPYTLPWHTTDNSDLSLQWGQLSRPYSSTDRSSSLGSMESLDTPTPTAQPYSDSQNSPVDPTLFNNKRDSAYSSFSASSNTSDYATVPLRPGEACSMDNLLQSLGPACRGYPGGDTLTLGSSSGEAPDEAQLITHKSRSLTRPRPRPVEVKERPSSCCYEEDHRGGDFQIVRNGERGADRKMNPPQPPTRKDSFRATRGRTNGTDKRCVSAPIEVSDVSSYYGKNKSSLNVESGIHNGFPAPKEGDTTGNFKEDTLESNFIQRRIKDSRHIRCETSASNKDCNSDTTSDHLGDPETASRVPNTSSRPASLLGEYSMEVEGQSHIRHTQNKHSSTGLHRHSAPDKLLATQLQLLQFDNDSPSLESNPPDRSSSPCDSQWSQSSLQPTGGDQEASQNHLQGQSNRWGGSRCSTPGSVFLDGDDGCSSEKPEGMVVNGGSPPLTEHHHPWGRSVSVPGDPTGSSTQGKSSSDQILERDFEPLSAAASVDTLLEEQKAVDSGRIGGKQEENVEGETDMRKSHPSRNHRRNRRRNERFATNLRNEIQRKKAQLQRSHGPGGLLHSEETVQEEEGPELNEDGADPYLPPQERTTKVAFASPVGPQDASTAPVEKSNTSNESKNDALQTQPKSTTYTQDNNISMAVKIEDPGVANFGVGIRVVEEPAPAGKARRWRWTPEHKLQPEPEPDRRCAVPSEKVLGVTGSRHGVCAFTSSSTSSYSRSSSSSRKDESEILPFADRMKFFEATSKGLPASNVTCRRQKKPTNHPELQEGELGQQSTQRRYSYQGGLQQDSALLLNTMEARRLSVSTSRERQREKEREQAREREERAREREERMRERENQREKERKERELEMEKARLREIQRERDREERLRQWEMERERELQLERQKELEKERLRKERENELERERERQREEDDQLNSHQEFYGRSSGIKEQNQDFQHQGNFHSFQSSKTQMFSHNQTQNQGPRSAFHPVHSHSHSQALENQQHPQQGFSTRSYTATETYPARQQETPKLDRKYSLTERDYQTRRRESRAPDNVNHHPPHHQPAPPQQQGPRWGRGQSVDDRNGHGSAPPPAPLSLRGRAMSENDLRFDSSHRWSPSISMASSQTLSEVEEGCGRIREGGESADCSSNNGRTNRRKTPPPPRPPPPKWEQFHRRRASHSNIFSNSSSTTSITAPHSIPPSITTTKEEHYPNYSTQSNCSTQSETSRQRSYSLPPERHEIAISDGCTHCCSRGNNQTQTTRERTFSNASSSSNQNRAQTQEHSVYSHNINIPPPNQNHPVESEERQFTVAPPSPLFSRRGFRPVAPPQRKRQGSGESLADLPHPTEDGRSSFSEMNYPHQEQVTVKPYKYQSNVRPGAEWERTPSPRVHSDSTQILPVVENGGTGVILNPESYFTIDYEQQQQQQQQQQLRLRRGFQEKIPELGTESETTLSPSPAHSLDVELDVPMETDIDDFQEDEGLPLENEPITSELPCFALPVTVLETDIDTYPDSEASPSGRVRVESGSLEEELLEPGESSRERLSLDEFFPQNSEGESGTESWRGAEHNTDSLDRRSGASSSCSSYYSTSAAKAQLLSQMKDFADHRERDDNDELTYKKQLMESLRKKLGVLREAQRGLQEDIRANAQLGEEVESMVVGVCKPNEVDKFRMFIGDLDKVVSLLLSLSGRLLRVETTLDTLDPETEHHERLPLLEKKCQLMRQLSEAQDLKDHVDRREQAVSRVLARCLSPEQHRDYSHFVKMKAALLVEQRQLEDKIRLGEEQLRGLRESLGLGLGIGIGMGMSMGYGCY